LYDARSRSNASQNITASAAHARTRYSQSVPIDHDGPSGRILPITSASPRLDNSLVRHLQMDLPMVYSVVFCCAHRFRWVGATELKCHAAGRKDLCVSLMTHCEAGHIEACASRDPSSIQPLASCFQNLIDTRTIRNVLNSLQTNDGDLF